MDTRPRAVFLDLDGTVYRGSQACTDAPESIQRLLEAGYEIRYLTNNSAARPIAITEKLAALNIPCQPEWVATSGITAAHYLRASGFKNFSYVGEPGLGESLAESNLQPVGLGDLCDALVVGICRSFTYEQMRLASQSIRQGAQFIATNLDPTYPVENGCVIPGAGSIVAAIATASEVNPTVIGKPEPRMVLDLCQELNMSPAHAVVVGDRIDTDIVCGMRAGAETWLVLTGVTEELPNDQRGSRTLAGLVKHLTGSL